MPDQLRKVPRRVVGVKQVLRALNDDALEQVFLAMDAAPALRRQVEDRAMEKQVRLTMVASMEELGQMCGVDVPSAAAGLKRARENV